MVTVRNWTAHEVRALIQAIRSTHDEFAHDLGVSSRIIDRWVSETEDVVPRQVNQRALDTVLRLADSESVARFVELTAGLPSIAYDDGKTPSPAAPQSAAEPVTQTNAEERSGGVREATASAPDSPASAASHHLRGARTSPLDGEGVATDPRTPEAGEARHRERTLIMSAANESAAFAQRAGQTNVHRSSLEQIEADIDRISREYLTEPLVPLVGEMRYVRNMAFAALEGRQYPAQTRQLYRAAAQLCGLLASASSDLAFYDAAQTQARTARLCAELAEDPATESWVLAIQSLTAFWDERPAAAADKAVEGQSKASGPIDLLRLASLEARARARVGNLAGAQDAIDRGRRILENSDAMPYRTIFDFPAANALRCFGSSYLWLGAYDDAQAALNQALQLFVAGPAEPESSYAHLAVTRIDLALAHLGRGDIDTAEEILRLVLDLSPERRLSGIVRRSRDLHLALAHPRYTNAHTARELTIEIEEFCSVSARHALSDGSA